MQLFHYHLVTSRVREVEARYIGKLAFDLVARHGRIGEELTSYEPGIAWNELDAMGFKLRLTELEKGAVNVVVQPGQWPTPRVDHLGFVLDEEEFERAIERAEENDLRVQEHGGRRTFVSTNAGYRLELHPPREWIEELLAQGDELQPVGAAPQGGRPGGQGESPGARSSTPSATARASRSARPSSASSAAARRAGRSSSASCSSRKSARARARGPAGDGGRARRRSTTRAPPRRRAPGP